MMDSKFDVKTMNLEWLVEKAEKKIDPSVDLESYVDGVLLELDNIIELMPKLNEDLDNDKLTQNIYHLTQSFVYNHKIFLKTGRLKDLRHGLDLLSEQLIGTENNLDRYVSFIDEIQKHDTNMNNDISENLKVQFYKKQSKYFSECILDLDYDDYVNTLIAKKYQAITEMTLDNDDLALELFNECIDDIDHLYGLEDINEQIATKNPLDEETYHALRLLGDIGFEVAKLEDTTYERISSLSTSIAYREGALDCCPLYLYRCELLK